MATDAQILSEARDSLLRILQSDTTNWSEAQRQQQLLDIKQLRELIADYEEKTLAASGRRIARPVRRVAI